MDLKRCGSLFLVFFWFLVMVLPGRAAEGFVAGSGSDGSAPVAATGPAPQESDTARRWVLAVGVCKFADTRIPQLKYCVADARSIVDYFRADGVPAERTLLLVDEDAGRQAIIRALTGIAEKIGPEDRFFFFYSSHGAGDAAGRTYFITFDTVLDDLAATAIPMQALKEAVKGINCRDVVLMIDTCHSGGAKALERPDEKALDKLLRTADRQTRVAVLTSSRTHESSIEAEELAHGTFTYYLLRGLAGESDNFPKDGKVSVTELFDYVMVAVPRATDRAQHPSAKFSYNWPGKKEQAVKVGRVKRIAPAGRAPAAAARSYAPAAPEPAAGKVSRPTEEQGRKRWQSVVE